MIDLLYMQQEFILTIYKLLYFNARDGYRSACFCYNWDIFFKKGYRFLGKVDDEHDTNHFMG